MGWISKLRRKDRGASLVEFAFVLPFLLLLVLGIIEFGFILGLNNDVRHGAREGARLAAVNGGSNGAIHSYVCESMEPLAGSGFSTLRMQLGDGGGDIGDTGSLIVEGDVDSLTGFMDVFLPNTLRSAIDFRLEQDASNWSSDGSLVTVSC